VVKAAKAENKADDVKLIPIALTPAEYKVMGHVLAGGVQRMDAIAKQHPLKPEELAVRADLMSLSDKVASGHIKCHVDDDFFKELGLTAK
jgi:hypothetical protein